MVRQMAVDFGPTIDSCPVRSLCLKQPIGVVSKVDLNWMWTFGDRPCTADELGPEVFPVVQKSPQALTTHTSNSSLIVYIVCICVLLIGYLITFRLKSHTTGPSQTPPIFCTHRKQHKSSNTYNLRSACPQCAQVRVPPMHTGPPTSTS